MAKLLQNTALLVWFLAAPYLAQASDLDPLLAELQQRAATVTNLQSHFTQEKHLSIFAERLQSQGRFIYQRPDHLRWELVSPVNSGFVLQGQKGQRWNGLSQESSQFSVKNDPVMGVIAQQLLAWARVDIDWLQSRYQIELLQDEPVKLQLIPRDPAEAEFIANLQILFAADRRHVAEVLMVEQEGDSTLLRFSDVTLNAKLPADAFSVPDY